MKNVFKMIIAILVIVIVGVSIFYLKARPAPIVEQPPITVEKSVVGCYEAHLGKDLFSLAILSQQGETFEGTLRIKNFEKDSSSGTLKGTYKDGILLGDYSFQSEGLDSVMQVIFKNSGDGFIRGYGDMNATGDRFANLNGITYDSSAVFKLSKQGCPTSL